jgi:hypothetical protein
VGKKLRMLKNTYKEQTAIIGTTLGMKCSKCKVKTKDEEKIMGHK